MNYSGIHCFMSESVGHTPFPGHRRREENSFFAQTPLSARIDDSRRSVSKSSFFPSLLDETLPDLDLSFNDENWQPLTKITPPNNPNVMLLRGGKKLDTTPKGSPSKKSKTPATAIKVQKQPAKQQFQFSDASLNSNASRSTVVSSSAFDATESLPKSPRRLVRESTSRAQTPAMFTSRRRLQFPSVSQSSKQSTRLPDLNETPLYPSLAMEQEQDQIESPDRSENKSDMEQDEFIYDEFDDESGKNDENESPDFSDDETASPSPSKPGVERLVIQKIAYLATRYGFELDFIMVSAMTFVKLAFLPVQIGLESFGRLLYRFKFHIGLILISCLFFNYAFNYFQFSLAPSSYSLAKDDDVYIPLQEYDASEVKAERIITKPISVSSEISSPIDEKVNGFESRLGKVEELVSSMSTTLNILTKAVNKHLKTSRETHELSAHGFASATQKYTSEIESLKERLEKLENDQNVQAETKVIDTVAKLESEIHALAANVEKRFSSMPVTEKTDVDSKIQQALAHFSKDNSGKFDYALRSAGAQVLKFGGLTSGHAAATHMHSDNSFVSRILSFFNKQPNFDTFLNPAELAIQTQNDYGKCWSVEGPRGHLTILLSRRIVPDAFSIEHVSRNYSPDIDDAPRKLEVWGVRVDDKWRQFLNNEHKKYHALPRSFLKHVHDKFYPSSQMTTNDVAKPIKLGNGVYDIDETSPVQSFALNAMDGIDIVQVRILSNWGNPNHTCLYRVRVHGKTFQ